MSTKFLKSVPTFRDTELSDPLSEQRFQIPDNPDVRTRWISIVLSSQGSGGIAELKRNSSKEKNRPI